MKPFFRPATVAVGGILVASDWHGGASSEPLIGCIELLCCTRKALPGLTALLGLVGPDSGCIGRKLLSDGAPRNAISVYDKCKVQQYYVTNVQKIVYNYANIYSYTYHIYNLVHH